MRPEIITKIAELENPLAVNLVNLKIADDEILEIMTHIKKCKPHAVKIDFDMNNIGDVGAETLGKALGDFGALDEISIQFNNIGEQGAKALFRLKRNFPQLEILFHGNQIKDAGKMLEIERAACSKVDGP